MFFLFSTPIKKKVQEVDQGYALKIRMPCVCSGRKSAVIKRAIDGGKNRCSFSDATTILEDLKLILFVGGCSATINARVREAVSM